LTVISDHQAGLLGAETGTILSIRPLASRFPAALLQALDAFPLALG